MSPSKILIPVAGSPASLRVVDVAIEMLARNSGNSFVLLHFQHIGTIDPAGVSEAMPANWLHEAALQASAQALKDAKGKCEGASVAFKMLARPGQTAETIAQVAREEDVGHIVTGLAHTSRLNAVASPTAALTLASATRGVSFSSALGTCQDWP